MDDRASAELRRLQARAYAPEADIHEDDGALRRLEELQALSRASVLTRPQDVEDPAPAIDGPREDDEIPDFAALLESPSDVAEPPSRRRWRLSGKWVAFLWPASLVVVAGVAGVVSHETAPRAPLIADAHHVATLQQDPDVAAPDYFGLAETDSVAFQPFFGLTPVVAEGIDWGAAGDTCLLLIPTVQMDADISGFQGPMFSGCGAGAFPTTIALKVTTELPAALQDRFPEGSALQFVLEGSRIDVYSDAE